MIEKEPESTVLGKSKVYYARRFVYHVRVDVGCEGMSYQLKGLGGFDWGCNSNHSNNLSWAILYDFTDSKEIAQDYAKQFNYDFISCMPTEGFALPGEVVKDWLRKKGV